MRRVKKGHKWHPATDFLRGTASYGKPGRLPDSDATWAKKFHKELFDELEVDAAAFSEHRQNLKHKDNKHGFSQLFNGGEADVRSVVGHNVHENVSRVQQGGTSLLLFGD